MAHWARLPCTTAPQTAESSLVQHGVLRRSTRHLFRERARWSNRCSLCVCTRGCRSMSLKAMDSVLVAMFGPDAESLQGLLHTTTVGIVGCCHRPVVVVSLGSTCSGVNTTTAIQLRTIAPLAGVVGERPRSCNMYQLLKIFETWFLASAQSNLKDQDLIALPLPV